MSSQIEDRLVDTSEVELEDDTRVDDTTTCFASSSALSKSDLMLSVK